MLEKRRLAKEKVTDDYKVTKKYNIFVNAFLLEDLGQALCQFIYYEQFKTEVSAISIAKAMLMACISIMTLKLFLFGKKSKSKSKSKL